MHPVTLPSTFDGVGSRTVFCLWTGEEIMSEDRLRSLWSIFRNTACPVAFLNKDTYQNWIQPEFPLHPAFQYLSPTHKADYLRCYLMHHYGGGYTDIKQTTRSWVGFFAQLEDSDKLALGYNEVAHGIPHVSGEFGDTLRAAHNELIGLCAFIFKRRTALTQAWITRTDALLDTKLAALQQHPACHPLDQTGILMPNGEPSQYPLRWAELLGEIFHPLIYQYRQQLLPAPINPVFSGYR